MRRMSASVFAWLLLMGFASDGTANATFGYRDTGLDADDANDAVDIRSTTRKIWQDQKGHRWLSITVRAYERLGRDWDVLASIDGRGGPDRESRVSFVNIQGTPVPDTISDDVDRAPNSGWYR